MGLFQKIFGGTEEQVTEPNIRFGRYSDSYKEEEHYESWNQSLEAFEAASYLEAYEAFFKYLKDGEEENVRYEIKERKLYFEFFQGSKRIYGTADRKKLTATAKIAQTAQLNVAFLRRLLEQNFNLKYSRFALDEEKNICITFDTYTLDGSPYKLYYALKELATNADKQDDLLVEEFRNVLKEVENKHLIAIPEQEKLIKYTFIKEKIQRTLTIIEQGKLDAKQYPGAIAYLLLDLTYRLDYLIQPQGYMMETLERIHRKYFEGKTNTVEKNKMLQQEFQTLLDRSKEDYFREFYRTTATFGITSPENHNRVATFIEGELPNMDWYNENGYPEIALAILGYIVGYCMFNYAIPKPDRALFDLYYKIVEPKFYKSLGFNVAYYNSDDQRFNTKTIRKAFEQIKASNAAQFPSFNPSVSKLKFDSLPNFTRSYLLMIHDLDLTKKVN